MRFDRYQLTPLAEADLEEIWVYTLREWSLDQANSYIHDVIDAFEGLRDGSKRGRPTDIRAGYFKYAVGSHVIYFRSKEKPCRHPCLAWAQGRRTPLVMICCIRF